jgi:hypothetical protein
MACRARPSTKRSIASRLLPQGKTETQSRLRGRDRIESTSRAKASRLVCCRSDQQPWNINPAGSLRLAGGIAVDSSEVGWRRSLDEMVPDSSEVDRTGRCRRTQAGAPSTPRMFIGDAAADRVHEFYSANSRVKLI